MYINHYETHLADARVSSLFYRRQTTLSQLPNPPVRLFHQFNTHTHAHIHKEPAILRQAME